MEGQGQPARWWKIHAKDDRGDAWDPSKRLTQDHPREVRKPDATGEIPEHKHRRQAQGHQLILEQAGQSQASVPPTPECAESWRG